MYKNKVGTKMIFYLLKTRPSFVTIMNYYPEKLFAPRGWMPPTSYILKQKQPWIADFLEINYDPWFSSNITISTEIRKLIE